MRSLLQQKPFLSSALLNAFFFGVCLSLLYTRFGTTDDLEMQMVLAGKGLLAESSPNLRWTHLFIGTPLSAAYRAFPSIPWYGWYLTLAHWMGMTAILYSVLLRQSSFLRLGIFLAFFATAEVLLLQELQYTSTALILGTGAVFLLFTAIQQSTDKRRTTWWISATALLLFVEMMRWDAFLLVVILGTPLLLFAILEEKKQAVRHLLLATGILVAAWGLEQSHYLIQNQDLAWEHYNTYKHSLAAHDILDYKKPQYQWSPSTADDYFYQVGWKYEDLVLFQHWFFADSTVYGLQQFKALQKAFQDCPFTEEHTEQRYWQFFISQVWSDYVFYGFLFLFLLLLFTKGNRNWYILLAVQLGLIFAILAFLYVYKHLPERVSYPLAFYLMALGTLFANGALLERSTKVKVLATLSLLALSNLKLSSFRSYQTAIEKQHWSAALDSLQAKPEHLYIGGGDFYLQPIMTPYQSLEDTLFDAFNMLDFGHFANSPNHYQQLTNFGIKNIHLQAPLDSNIYFIHRYNASIIPWYINFVERHYNRYIEFELLRKEEQVNIAVYRIKERIRKEPNSQGISLSNQEEFGIFPKDPNKIEVDSTKPQINIKSKEPFTLHQ
ncbi:MAG: hypothetical protein ACRBFS_07565 [Aureispira sp.]